EPVAAVAAEPAAVVEQPLDEPPSGPQPMLSVDELPPPPEPPRLADGEPEPMLETFDTGAIHLGTPEADALIAENSSLPLEVVGDVEPAGDVEPPADDAPPVGAETPADEEPVEASGEDDLDELDLDELVELDDEELEELDDQPEPPPPPPPPPPSSGPPPLEAEAPVQTASSVEPGD